MVRPLWQRTARGKLAGHRAQWLGLRAVSGDLVARLAEAGADPGQLEGEGGGGPATVTSGATAEASR